MTPVGGAPQDQFDVYGSGKAGAAGAAGGNAEKPAGGSGGAAGKRGTGADLPTDIPATAGQGAVGGSSGKNNTSGAEGGTGYAVLSW
ncbi:hypothetical protein ACFWAR_19380 [Streptomyces sp. NPDC059917]|uniref:hypothetical protein n=1 Tax=Streptomyces sp. NPDC059917 TaxID=3347002 RepID=UPI00365188D8